tara:strand:- start:496 stop:711 length:216 start_codon:yes stop_codon:yes gene_type:complete
VPLVEAYKITLDNSDIKKIYVDCFYIQKLIKKSKMIEEYDYLRILILVLSLELACNFLNAQLKEETQKTFI